MTKKQKAYCEKFEANCNSVLWSYKNDCCDYVDAMKFLHNHEERFTRFIEGLLWYDELTDKHWHELNSKRREIFWKYNDLLSNEFYKENKAV